MSPLKIFSGCLLTSSTVIARATALNALLRMPVLTRQTPLSLTSTTHPARKLNRELINRLATCEYITEHRNMFITGATGSGKTYMACAFGLEACKQHFKIKYVRLPDLLLELEVARNEGTYKKVQARYANPVLLIIDEWLLLKPTETEQHDILELLHRRRKKSSTIFCSQYDPSGWYDQLGGDDSPLAKAILDRIKHDAYKINIIPTDPTNYKSMREVYGLDPALSE